MSPRFIHEIGFLTFNFMDEHQTATQINFLQYSHKVTDCARQVIAGSLNESKGTRWICSFIFKPAIYNLQ